MKFEDIKIGDRVRRVRGGNHGNYLIGEIGVVVELKVGSGRVRLDRDTGEYVHDPVNLELVEATPSDLSVESALAFLKSKGEVVFKPKFDMIPVSLNSKYMAEVHKDFVKVGCQEFDFYPIEQLYAAVQKARNHGK